MITQIWKVKDIKPAPYNPRVTLKPDDDEWEALNNSVQKFGLVEPLIINKTTGLLISGHQRLNILKANKIPEAEVVIVELDEEQEKLLNIALNKIDGDWDFRKLEELFEEISPEDIKFTGFNQEELNNMFDSIPDSYGNDEQEETEETEKEEKDDDNQPDLTEKQFLVFLSFPTKELAENYLKERNVEATYKGTARNITIKMEGLDYGTVN